MGSLAAKSTMVPALGAGAQQHISNAFGSPPREQYYPTRPSPVAGVLSPVHAAIMDALRSMADPEGRCAPTLPELGRMLATTPLFIAERLRVMEMLGYLRIEDRPPQPVIYHLAQRFVPALEEGGF